MKKSDAPAFMKNVDTLVREYLIPAIKAELKQYYEEIDRRIRLNEEKSGIHEIETIKSFRKRLYEAEHEIRQLKTGIGRYIFESVKEEKAKK
jgi:ribosomal protein S8